MKHYTPADLLCRDACCCAIENVQLVCSCYIIQTKTDCAVCTKGYSNTIGYKCSKCSGSSKATVITVILIILALLAALLWYITCELTGVTDANDSVSTATSTNIWQKLSKLPWNKLRIPLIVIQILTQYISITGLKLPDMYFDFLSWTSIINMDIGWLSSLGCITQIEFYDKLLLNTLIPFGIVLALVCTYSIAQYRLKVQATTASTVNMNSITRTTGLESIRSRHYSAFLLMTFLMYSTVSTVVFQTFACDNIESTGISYLRADYSVICDTSRHNAYKAYAAVMIIVYPIGIPLLYTWLLYRERRHFNQSNKRSSGPRLTDSNSIQQLQQASEASVQHTKFLWSAYKSKRYYWEVVECARRLLLTGFVVFIFPNSSAQAAVACLFAAFSLAIVLQFKPHADASDAGVYITGSTIIFLSMFLSLMVKVDISEDDAESQHVFSILLIILNVGMIIATIAQVAFVGKRSCISTSDMRNNDSNKSSSSNSRGGAIVTDDTTTAAVAPYATSSSSTSHSLFSRSKARKDIVGTNNSSGDTASSGNQQKQQQQQIDVTPV
jgi:hypothetical protein